VLLGCLCCQRLLYNLFLNTLQFKLIVIETLHVYLLVYNVGSFIGIFQEVTSQGFINVINL